jgi:excisionase family DNA binding protein
VSTRKRNLAPGDLQQAFAGDDGGRFPVIMSPAQLAELLGLSVKTVYAWMAEGRLDGAYRKRGKHNLIWRDRALEIIFNGADWNHVPKQQR